MKWEQNEIPSHVIRDEVYLPVTANNMRAIARRGFVHNRSGDRADIHDIVTPHECMFVVEYIILRPNLMRSLKKQCADIGMAVINNDVGWDIHIGLERWLETFAFTPYLISREHPEMEFFANWQLQIEQKLRSRPKTPTQ